MGCSIKNQPPREFLGDSVQKGTFTLGMFGNTTLYDTSLKGQYHTTGIATAANSWAGANSGRISSKEMDALIEKFDASWDRKERLKILAQIDDLIQKNYWNIPLYHRREAAVLPATFKGLQTRAWNKFRISRKMGFLVGELTTQKIGKIFRIVLVAVIYGVFALLFWPFAKAILFAVLFAFALIVSKKLKIKQNKITNEKWLVLTLVNSIVGLFFIPLLLVIISTVETIKRCSCHGDDQHAFLSKPGNEFRSNHQLSAGIFCAVWV